MPGASPCRPRAGALSTTLLSVPVIVPCTVPVPVAALRMQQAPWLTHCACVCLHRYQELLAKKKAVAIPGAVTLTPHTGKVAHADAAVAACGGA